MMTQYNDSLNQTKNLFFYSHIYLLFYPHVYFINIFNKRWVILLMDRRPYARKIYVFLFQRIFSVKVNCVLSISPTIIRFKKNKYSLIFIQVERCSNLLLIQRFGFFDNKFSSFKPYKL